MTHTPTREARPTRLIAAAALAVIAMLVLAGPASAHHGRHHHRRHHSHSFSSPQGPAGTIASFDQTSGKLTINLSEEETITGLVTEDTQIEFAHACDHHEWQGDGSGSSERRQLWEHGDWGQSEASTADLKPGETVEDAVLIVAGGKATFLKIELAAPASSEESPPQAP